MSLERLLSSSETAALPEHLGLSLSTPMTARYNLIPGLGV